MFSDPCHHFQTLAHTPTSQCFLTPCHHFQTLAHIPTSRCFLTPCGPLQTLAHTYQSMVQDDGAYQEYLPLAKHIADDYFREYPSKDVQLLVACCIADVLRVYAPRRPTRTPRRSRSVPRCRSKRGGL